VAELSEAINLDEIAVGLPSRIHNVTARKVAEASDRIALVESGASWSYRDLGQGVVGTLPPGVEGRIRTLDGIPLSKEQVGELHVRGRNVMRGYYLAPELTAKVIDSEGWLNTGNIARFDGDCLYIVGRTQDVISAFPAKIEAILNSHKDVQSAIIGGGLNDNGELVAFVQPMPRSRIKPTDLMDIIKPRLPSYIRPPKIVVVDVLPGSSTGRTREHELAQCLRGDQAAARQAAKVQRRTHLT